MTAFNKRYQVILLCCSWFAINIFLLLFRGIHLDLEAAKYIRQAETLASTHAYTSKNYIFYSTQILIIYIFQQLGLNIKLLAFFQLVCNGLSMIAFHQVSARFSSYTTASILTAFLILLYPYNQYNTYLQTETIYYALLIFYIRYLFFIEKITLRQIIILSLFWLLLLLTRPTAFYLLFPTIFVVFKISKTGKVIQLTALAFIIVLSLGLLNFALVSGGDFNFLMPIDQQMIICGLPAVNENLVYSHTRTETIITILAAITRDPATFIQLCAGRTIAFFGVYRRYFSMLTNTYNIIIFGIMYITGIAGLLTARQGTSKNYAAVKTFCIALIVITWLSVLVTCDDWHNRFIAALTPFFLLLSLPFVEKQVSRYRIRYILP